MVVRVLRVLKNRAAGSIAPTGSFADRRSVCVGADDFHRPGNAAIAGSFAEQSGHWIGKAGQPEVTAAGVNARPTPPANGCRGKKRRPQRQSSRFRLPFALYCRAGDFARRGTLRPAGSSAGRCKHRPLRKAGACRVVLRRGRAPALTPALRTGEPSKRRLRAAVISSARKRCDRGKLCRTKQALDREGRGNRKSPRPKTAPQFLFFTRSPGTPSGWPE